MATAVEEFFPEDSDVLEKEGIVDIATSDLGPYQLRRLSASAPSIVGEGNGTRPGGYVLVIDGTALGHVGVTTHGRLWNAYAQTRLLLTIRTSDCCCISGLDAKASSVVVSPLFRKLLLSNSSKMAFT